MMDYSILAYDPGTDGAAVSIRSRAGLMLYGAMAWHVTPSGKRIIGHWSSSRPEELMATVGSLPYLPQWTIDSHTKHLACVERVVQRPRRNVVKLAEQAGECVSHAKSHLGVVEVLRPTWSQWASRLLPKPTAESIRVLLDAMLTADAPWWDMPWLKGEREHLRDAYGMALWCVQQLEQPDER